MTIEKFLTMVGWFEGPAQKIPTHDPIPNCLPNQPSKPEDVAKCLCLRCEQPLTLPCRVFSLVYVERKVDRSYFYRLHQQCANGECRDMDEKCLSAVAKFGLESTNLVIK